ncbi:hypothetical protein RHGRI_021593 [Rhododendron griersonianum]|uniref:RING-type E3 ubiquitin transferase n=1 Tax=Rhododendron griersonianum TaxID=479676 RepID=A0AAV6JKQ5_9ERIC|nr:hypothetical protein RHGRI_021593 [Rhododendron griersonianum]
MALHPSYAAAQADSPYAVAQAYSPMRFSYDKIKLNPPLAIIIEYSLIGTFIIIMGCVSVLLTQHCIRRHRRLAYTGLDPSIIDALPTFVYSEIKKDGMISLECAVCLNEFENAETLRLLPKCCHVFHPDCIEAWLSAHFTCPVCRSNLAPKPDAVEPEPADSVGVNDSILDVF